jgi:hypothetical protein
MTERADSRTTNGKESRTKQYVSPMDGQYVRHSQDMNLRSPKVFLILVSPQSAQMVMRVYVELDARKVSRCPQGQEFCSTVTTRTGMLVRVVK